MDEKVGIRIENLCANFFGSFGTDDQDEHTRTLTEHVRVFLTCASKRTPAIAPLLDARQRQRYFERVPFLGKECTLQQQLNGLSIEPEAFIFHMQILGLLPNSFACRQSNCDRDCKLYVVKGRGYVWRCPVHRAMISVTEDSWFGKMKKPFQCLDSIMMYIRRESAASSASNNEVSTRTMTDWIEDWQNVAADMNATIRTLIKNAFDIDGTALSGHSTVKSTRNHKRGAVRYVEKTIVLITQRGTVPGGTRRATAIFSRAHENSDMADQLLMTTVARETPGFGDGGHSKISAWCHASAIVQAPFLTVNHSKEFKNKETGAHINFGENLNMHLKQFLVLRGGGSNTREALKRNLNEFLFWRWFTPTRCAKYRSLIFLFSLWTCMGFHYEEARHELNLHHCQDMKTEDLPFIPFWERNVSTIDIVQVQERIRQPSPMTRIRKSRSHSEQDALNWECNHLIRTYGYKRCSCRSIDLHTCCLPLAAHSTPEDYLGHICICGNEDIRSEYMRTKKKRRRDNWFDG